VDSQKRRFLREEQFLRGNVADKGITPLYTVSQIGSPIPRKSPAVRVVLFQFFLFRGGRLLLPRGPRTRCTGARRLNTIGPEKPNSGPVNSRDYC
jgi:hypothetical protein